MCTRRYFYIRVSPVFVWISFMMLSYLVWGRAVQLRTCGDCVYRPSQGHQSIRHGPWQKERLGPSRVTVTWCAINHLSFINGRRVHLLPITHTIAIMTNYQSTPCRGTSDSVAEYNRNYRWALPTQSHRILTFTQGWRHWQRNNQKIQEGLKRKMNVGILPFLKEMVYRILVKVRGTNPDGEEIRRDGETIFEEMLNDAVNFCNDETNTNREMLWQELNT